MGQEMTPRELVNDWLDRIGETDPETRQGVLMKCSTDPDARRYFVGQARAGYTAGQIRALQLLRSTIGSKYSLYSETVWEFVILSVAWRGIGVADFQMPREKYDGIGILEMVSKTPLQGTE